MSHGDGSAEVAPNDLAMSTDTDNSELTFSSRGLVGLLETFC